MAGGGASPPRSVHFRLEIGRVPRRDRSHSASKSVHFRLEIGRTPPRDRSHSASKSVHFRLEIGPTPHRVQDAHRRRLEVQPQGLRARKAPSTHHTSTVRSALVPIFPRTGIRRREHERSERTVLTASRRQREERISLTLRIGRLRRLRWNCTWEEDPLKKRQPFFA